MSNILHTIEDPRTKNNQQRNSCAPGKRFHQRFLTNMRGAFLTLLDKDGKILLFAGGALRRRVDEKHDEVLVMTPSDLTRGFAGVKNEVTGAMEGFFPEYREVALAGDQRRRDYSVQFQDVPGLSQLLAREIKEAHSWGVLTVGPAPDKRWEGAAVNGKNSEEHLDNQTWRSARPPKTVNVIGSGGCNMADRLHPKAQEYASMYPSAWMLALAAGKLFGGITQAVPSNKSGATGDDIVKESTLVNLMFASEMNFRKARRDRMDSTRRGKFSGSAAPLNPNIKRERPRHQPAAPTVAQAVDPATMEALESLKVEKKLEAPVAAEVTIPKEVVNKEVVNKEVVDFKPTNPRHTIAAPRPKKKPQAIEPATEV